MNGVFITRSPNGKYYYKSKEIDDEPTMVRISKLCIPPAWKNVRVAKDPNSYLQAIGFDKTCKRQYIYHPLYVELNEEEKYKRLGKFIINKHKIFQFIEAPNQSEYQRMASLLFKILFATSIRVGGDTPYDTYGLTTLQKKHFKFNEGHTELKIDFVGKRGVRHIIKLLDKNLLEEIYKLYCVKKGIKEPMFTISAQDLNKLIKEITETDDITCKDFRTYIANYSFVKYVLEDIALREQDPTRKYKLGVIIKGVSQKLGNTEGISKKSYIFPELMKLYEKDINFYIKNRNISIDEIILKAIGN